MDLKLKSIHTTVFAIISMMVVGYLGFDGVLDGMNFAVCFLGLLGLMGYRKKLNTDAECSVCEFEEEPENGEKSDAEIS